MGVVEAKAERRLFLRNEHWGSALDGRLGLPDDPAA
jgi:hypothetical protein